MTKISIPPILLYIATPFLLVGILLAGTIVFTQIRYRIRLRSYLSTDTTSKTKRPPPIPYALPFLGNALSFLAPNPGLFWANLFQTHPRATGSCTLLLGGRHTHILFSHSAVQALFKTKGLTRDGFNFDIVTKGLGMTAAEGARYYGLNEPANADGLTPIQEQEKINHDFLLKTERTNELTSKFVEVLKGELGKDLQGDGEVMEIGLYEFLRERMFTASTNAVMGTQLLEMYPNLCGDFFDYDRVMLSLFFGLPKLLIPEAFAIRKRVLDGLEKFHTVAYDKYKGRPVDPSGEIAWESDYGSRINRARQQYYSSRDLSLRGSSALDLGFLFGLSSNAIPATGWMLMHVLDPNGDPTLLGRIVEELKQSQHCDGSIDISTLISLPLLQSLFHEVLRLYVDVFVTRELDEDLVLPLDDASKRHVFLGKKSVVIAPSWLGHRDQGLWTSPPSTAFYAERFLRLDPETDKETFTMSGTAGKFFPFGGGKSICPGRVFAKQEVLGAFAMVLLSFEFEVLGFMDLSGRETETFPGLRKGYGGAGVMAADGDLRVKIQRRK